MIELIHQRMPADLQKTKQEGISRADKIRQMVRLAVIEEAIAIVSASKQEAIAKVGAQVKELQDELNIERQELRA